jgi:predicted dehydrogenase
MLVEVDDLSSAGYETAAERSGAICELATYAGWSSYAGFSVDEGAIQRGLAAAVAGFPLLADALERQGEIATNFVTDKQRQERQQRASERPSAVLFGLGNYAKTQILPVIRKSLDLHCIHEIDPDQILPLAKLGVSFDTSPFPRDYEEYDAWFIAGYHHHHVPLAVHAIGQGACAVVEKPVATTWEQLRELEVALESSETGELIACFQRRYSPMQEWAFNDINIAEDKAVHYHCIVYEIPLPTRHWYNWPNAGSRLISNGCHWIDHFMSLNHYAPAIGYQVKRLSNGDIAVAAELENGAAFTMLVTENGSERLGVRDHVEVRSGDVTVKMVDQAYYEAESSKRVIRRRSINPTKAYKRMYEGAVGRIRRGEAGDSTASLESTKLMLRLEDELGNCQGTGNAVSPRRE